MSQEGSLWLWGCGLYKAEHPKINNWPTTFPLSLPELAVVSQVGCVEQPEVGWEGTVLNSLLTGPVCEWMQPRAVCRTYCRSLRVPETEDSVENLREGCGQHLEP